jgi:alpha-tubulin suppressor-like RCC1 family protein
MSLRKIQCCPGPIKTRVVFFGWCLLLALNPALGLAAAGLEALPGAPLAGAVTVAGNPDMQRIATGEYHSLAITFDGTLWAWGDNRFGQLGDGTRARRTSPVQVLTGVAAVATGTQHSLALKADGTAWAWGFSSYGQVGDGTTVDHPTPVQIMSEVMAIAGGGNQSFAVKQDNSLWAWGWNYSGQLGDGTRTSRLTPVEIMTEVKEVAASDSHTVALKTDGSLWEWGGGWRFQLIPVQVLTDVAAVAAGYASTFALRTDGSLWAWGTNESGQLGDGTTTPRESPVQVMSEVAAVAAGFSSTFALKTDGSLWAWGANTFGQIGDGTNTNRSTPVQVLSGVAAMAGDYYHTIAFRTNGSLWAWGYNSIGQLGDGTTVNRLDPVPVPAFPPTSAPDFAVTNITLNPSAPLANGTFSASITVKNRGTAAGTPGTLEVWANQPEVQGCGALGDQSLALTALAAGAKQTVKVSGLPAGAAKYQTLRIVVDNQCQTAESDEANNQSVKSYRVVTRPVADFVVTDIVLTPNRPSANGTFSAAVTVKNQGSGSADAGTLAVWVDQPAVPTCAATGDAAAVIGLLAPGAKRTLTLSGLSAGATGAKSLRAYADSDCTTPEAYDGNNQRVKAYSVVP